MAREGAVLTVSECGRRQVVYEADMVPLGRLPGVDTGLTRTD